MSDRFKSTVIIYSAEYGKVSYFGNPSLVLNTSRGVFKSLANAGFVYGVNPRDLREVKAELSLTPACKVTNLRVLKLAAVGGLKDQVSEYLEEC